jgi:hypothetical protein
MSVPAEDKQYKRLTIEFLFEEDSEFGFFDWYGDYRVVMNEIPADSVVGLRETLAQSDTFWESAPSVVVDSIGDKTGVIRNAVL